MKLCFLEGKGIRILSQAMLQTDTKMLLSPFKSRMLKIRTRLEEKGKGWSKNLDVFDVVHSARKETIMELDHRETSSNGIVI
jgi:hypothetical protein